MSWRAEAERAMELWRKNPSFQARESSDEEQVRARSPHKKSPRAPRRVTKLSTVARRFDVTEEWLLKEAATGALKVIELDGARHVDPDEVDQWFHARTEAPGPRERPPATARP